MVNIGQQATALAEPTSLACFDSISHQDAFQKFQEKSTGQGFNSAWLELESCGLPSRRQQGEFQSGTESRVAVWTIDDAEERRTTVSVARGMKAV